jgi:restriction endonuclease Mrr
MKKISQSQLILPLLDAIEEREGAATARDVYDLVAEKIDLSADDRRARITISGHYYNAFEREVRWAQQRAKLQGLVRPADSRLWALTEKGHSALTKATPGRLRRKPLSNSVLSISLAHSGELHVQRPSF